MKHCLCEYRHIGKRTVVTGDCEEEGAPPLKKRKLKASEEVADNTQHEQPKKKKKKSKINGSAKVGSKVTVQR